MKPFRMSSPSRRPAKSFTGRQFRSFHRREARAGPVTLLTSPSARGTVLVVEDDPDGLEMLRRMLEALGTRVVLARDGAEALRLLHRSAPDLILCDLMLPLIDGFRVVSRMRAAPEWRRIPVIAVTGLGYQADLERTWATGFDGHLVKPVDIDTLAHVLNRYLPRRRPASRGNGANRRGRG